MKKSNAMRCIELYPRSFANSEQIQTSDDGSSTLRVLQWNLLADGLCGRHPDKGGFTDSPHECLDWECRRQGILAEVRRWNADILFFEELDHFTDLVSDLSDSFEGRFVAKRPSACLRFAPPLEDGVAIFIRENVLRFTHEFDEQRDVLQFENANQVALISEVSLVRTAAEGPANGCVDLVLAATHLRATKTGEGENIRRCQTLELRKHLEKRCCVTVESVGTSTTSALSTNISSVRNEQSDDTSTARIVPVLIGVDLNALPSLHARPAEVNQHILNGNWPAPPEYAAQAYAAMLAEQADQETDSTKSNSIVTDQKEPVHNETVGKEPVHEKLVHKEPVQKEPVRKEPFELKSAYRQVCGSEPSFTTWKARSSKQTLHTIDFVFYSCGELRGGGIMLEPKNVLMMPEAVPESMRKILAPTRSKNDACNGSIECSCNGSIGNNNAAAAAAATADIPTPNWNYPSDHFSLVVDFAISGLIS